MKLNKRNRRNFLISSGTVSLGFLGLYHFINNPIKASEKATGKVGYGPLKADPKNLIELPKGFSYRIISTQGNKMSDGLLVPGKPDGMATFFQDEDRTLVIRNHENSHLDPGSSPFGADLKLLNQVEKSKIYDFGNGKQPGTGGTTTFIYNHQTKSIEKEFLSLAGTIVNCAGGPTPWNSWISCEETDAKAGGNLEKDHGYNFEVPASAKIGLADPIPLKAMGRFRHEAVAVDPRTSIVYQTEDTHDGMIYRFISKVPGKLIEGGKLQALAIKEIPSCDTRNWEELESERIPVGKDFEVRWIDLDEIESPENDLRFRGFDAGAARFARGEGMWFGDNEVYFVCTNGGTTQTGQIFRYAPSPFEGQPQENESPGKLTLFAEPNDSEIVQNCDNLTVAPWGDLLLCEDVGTPFLVGVTPDGSFYKIAKQVGFNSEFAGVTVAPNGKTVFLNIQHAGLTLAIDGPWDSRV